MKKKYLAHIPMMRETREKIAMQMHMTAEMMVLAPSDSVFTEASKQLAVMAVAIDYGLESKDKLHKSNDTLANLMRGALDALIAAEARHNAGKNWGLTGDEAVLLRKAAGIFDDTLKKIPFNVYEAARQFVHAATAKKEMAI